MEDKGTVNPSLQDEEKDNGKLTIKEKRLDLRRKIEERMEEKRLKYYTEDYDYYFAE
jgi:hypothetical protein